MSLTSYAVHVSDGEDLRVRRGPVLPGHPEGSWYVDIEVGNHQVMLYFPDEAMCAAFVAEFNGEDE